MAKYQARDIITRFPSPSLPRRGYMQPQQQRTSKSVRASKPRRKLPIPSVSTSDSRIPKYSPRLVGFPGFFGHKTAGEKGARACSATLNITSQVGPAGSLLPHNERPWLCSSINTTSTPPSSNYIRTLHIHRCINRDIDHLLFHQRNLSSSLILVTPIPPDSPTLTGLATYHPSFQHGTRHFVR